MSDVEDTVIVIDDDPSLREALESLLSSVGLKVRLFESAAEFRAAKRPDGPCCLVLDVRLPGKSGLDLQTEMIGENAALPIIFITGHGDIRMTVRAMKSGAVEFLSKPFRDQELLDAVYGALQQDRARRADLADVEELRRRLATLTQREREVMALVVTGRMNKQIAGTLGLSEVTVKVHRGQVTRKMEARSVAELVRMADRLGLSAAAPDLSTSTVAPRG
ncbi:MAG TPA: response regulator transcription factor [Caulobacteraceae bacterium]|nr:response regulator transcription factor [Caulobacteraceae bacterium]